MGHAAKQKHEGGARAGQGVHEYAGGARWRLVDAGYGEGKQGGTWTEILKKNASLISLSCIPKQACELITDLWFKMQATHTPMVPYLHTPRPQPDFLRRDA